MEKEIKEELDKQKAAIDIVLKEEKEERARIDNTLAAYHETIARYELAKKNDIDQYHSANMKKINDRVSALNEELKKNSKSSEAIDRLLSELIK